MAERTSTPTYWGLLKQPDNQKSTRLATAFLRRAPDKFLLTKTNSSRTIEMPASLCSEYCSPSARNAVRVPFGISVRFRRNPQYRHGAHAVYDIKYHFVWITKYRYKILRGRIAERSRGLLRQSCEVRDVVIVRGRCRRIFRPRSRCSISRGVRRGGCRMNFRNGSKRYWGQHLWARGYFCASVDEETIKRYMKGRGGTRTKRASRSPRPPSLESAL